MHPRTQPLASSHTLPPTHRDQFHHAIPRFILRQFQVGPRKSKAERQKHFQRTREDPDYVLYYDIASGSLDVCSIGTIYGLKNLYTDANNPSNANELEQKLAILEKDASIVIKALHSNLPSGKATFKRCDVERLRKFLFVMHYRNMGGSYFDPDHPHGGSTIRKWLERYKAKHHCRTHTDVWLHVLRYYLDTPHSRILDHAKAIYDERGMEMVHLQMLNHVDPDMENYEALAYDVQASMSFLCIWEAHDTSEFILSDSGFGLWEGLSVSGDSVHRVFVVSPRIAVVLRSNWTPTFEKMGPVISDLLKIPQERPVPKLVDGSAGFRIPEGVDIASINWNTFRSPDDLFTFTITKLSLAQTDSLNAVLLKNVHHDGALTFLGKERMLRTIRAFCHDPTNKYDRPKFASLMRHLSIIPTNVTRPTLLSDGPVDTELYVALMEIQLAKNHLPSRWDRALSVFRLMKDTSIRMTCPFMLEHIFNLSAVMQECRNHFGGDVYKIAGGPFMLEPSLSEEVSLRVFQALDRFVLEGLGMRLAYDTKDILGQVAKDIVLVAFLDWVIDESSHVLVNMSVVTRQAVRRKIVCAG
ncbi:hypothetical protein EDD18DRAFT_159463 [Armillaria luteobubalina]|uniref:Uncharacterized protein n=1 Tax=Armillaria luteobubalina TaxID=153913 RepID=A0AA39Q911_9AGAR|nr:hypothetical protein EDD18DRAFT_159463 [Armillaria luteobubalina]